VFVLVAFSLISIFMCACLVFSLLSVGFVLERLRNTAENCSQDGQRPAEDKADLLKTSQERYSYNNPFSLKLGCLHPVAANAALFQ
jgi:hypothetical protein